MQIVSYCSVTNDNLAFLVSTGYVIGDGVHNQLLVREIYLGLRVWFHAQLNNINSAIK